MLLTPAAGILTMTKPLGIMPVTTTSYVVPFMGAISVIVAKLSVTVLPVKLMSLLVKPLTPSEKTALKRIGEAVAGSICKGAGSIVTVKGAMVGVRVTVRVAVIVGVRVGVRVCVMVGVALGVSVTAGVAVTVGVKSDGGCAGHRQRGCDSLS